MCAHPRASATRRSTSSAQRAAHLFGGWRGTCYSAWWMEFDSCTVAHSAHNAPQSVQSRSPHASAQKIDTTSTAPASLLSRAPHVRAMAPFGAERSNSSKSIAERALESNHLPINHQGGWIEAKSITEGRERHLVRGKICHSCDKFCRL